MMRLAKCVACALIGGAVVLAAAACGGSSSRMDSSAALSSVCARQAVRLQLTGSPANLGQAAKALRIVIRVERSLVAALAPRADAKATQVSDLRQAITSASRVLESIERSDSGQSMTPLRTSVPSSRRAIAAAHRLLAEACGASLA